MALPKFANDIILGTMRMFPGCCSAYTVQGVGLNGTDDERGPGRAITNAPPADVRIFTQAALDRLRTGIGASNRVWPIRIWNSFLLYDMYRKSYNSDVPGRSGRAFVICDNTMAWRHWARGSGFAEWCKRVPGVAVTSTREYKGSHNTPNRSYVITFSDYDRVQNYLQRSLDMLNKELAALRKRREESLRPTTRKQPPTIDLDRYW